jgi:drug/metabolite transporter (DMT)-like permease
MYQPPSDIAIITEIIVQPAVVLLIVGVFIWKIAYAMNKNVWKCMDRCDPLSGFLLILLFVFIPGSLLLHYTYRKIKKLLKRRHNRYNEIEDKYKWFSEHA